TDSMLYRAGLRKEFRDIPMREFSPNVQAMRLLREKNIQAYFRPDQHLLFSLNPHEFSEFMQIFSKLDAEEMAQFDDLTFFVAVNVRNTWGAGLETAVLDGGYRNILLGFMDVRDRFVSLESWSARKGYKQITYDP